MDVSLIFKILEESLKLWNSKESNKYIDQLVKLKGKWHEEYSKPLDERSDVKLDTIELQLKILCQSFIQAPKGKNP